MTIANHGQINVFMLQPADVIVVGGVVVTIVSSAARYVDGSPVYSFTGWVVDADSDGETRVEQREFTDFTASATFPRLLVLP